jgi:hypothetical protein
MTLPNGESNKIQARMLQRIDPLLHTASPNILPP